MMRQRSPTACWCSESDVTACKPTFKLFCHIAMATPVTHRRAHCLPQRHGLHHFCHFLGRASEFRLPRLSGASVFFTSRFAHVWKDLERLLEVLILELTHSCGAVSRRDRRSLPGNATWLPWPTSRPTLSLELKLRMKRWRNRVELKRLRVER